MPSIVISRRQCPGLNFLMSVDARRNDGWVLEQSTTADIDHLMTWFTGRNDITIWGGPSFRYPFSRESFYEDIYWGRMATFSLRDPSGTLAAFGQAYERFGRINLARLVANPSMRGCGVGKRLIGKLMMTSRGLFSCDEYSLFVFRENTVAYECYKSMGFVVADYPEETSYADVCFYLTRPVEIGKQQEGEENEQ